MTQLNIFDENQAPLHIHHINNGEYIYSENYFNTRRAQRYLHTFLRDINWKQEKMYMYGKELLFPRLMAWYGDPNVNYAFSGNKYNPNEWTEELMEIKQKIEKDIDAVFNCVLLNRYRDGSDSITWHSDDEKELGINPIIASVNFGAERVFQLKHKETKERLDIKLHNGSLLVMMGEFQHYWQHKIPKSKRIHDERINLTFRHLYQDKSIISN